MTLEELLEECPYLDVKHETIHDASEMGRIGRITLLSKSPEAADWLRAHGVVMVGDVIGCINKRAMNYSPLDDPIARPMNDVEIQLQLLCDDIRALKGGDDAK